jgi:hypothetical protein
VGEVAAYQREIQRELMAEVLSTLAITDAEILKNSQDIY